MFSNSNSQWSLMTINDPTFLSGKSIFDVIQTLQRALNFKYVIINQIYGVTEAIADLEEKENEIMNINDLLKMIWKVKQFDWGDFFLFKIYPTNWVNSDKIIYYPQLVNQSDTTIRAIDDQYIYIYTPYQEVMNVIIENYKIESLKKDLLENLDYPY